MPARSLLEPTDIAIWIVKYDRSAGGGQNAASLNRGDEINWGPMVRDQMRDAGCRHAKQPAVITCDKARRPDQGEVKRSIADNDLRQWGHRFPPRRDCGPAPVQRDTTAILRRLNIGQRSDRQSAIGERKRNSVFREGQTGDGRPYRPVSPKQIIKRCSVCFHRIHRTSHLPAAIRLSRSSRRRSSAAH